MENNQNVLVEDLSTPNAPNIGMTDENLSVDSMFQQASLPSLAKQIFSVIPIYGPTGGLFNIRKKAAANEFELVRREVSVVSPSASIPTSITLEAIQDLRAQFGKEADNVIGQLLRGLANDQENTATLAFLNAQSLDGIDLNLSNSLNAETNLFEITQRVNELVLQINSNTLRTYEAYAVIPFKPIAGIMALHNYAGGKNLDETGLFVAHFGQTKYYVNPDATSTKAYVGLKDTNNPSKSSGIFSPYQSQVMTGIDPATGNSTYNIYNRFAITASPLHVTGNEMFHMFDIIL